MEIQFMLMRLIALVIAIPIHEFAHALSAVKLGDDGPRRDGRLSILPQDHFDPLGAICCVLSSLSGFGLGWGRPVMVNPHLFRHPVADMAKVAAWGPVSNLILALLFALPIRFGLINPTTGEGYFLLTCVFVNLGLFCFNLIPLGPLDGAKIVRAFLPDRVGVEFDQFQSRWGGMILLGIIFLGRDLLSQLVSPAVRQLAGLFLVG